MKERCPIERVRGRGDQILVVCAECGTSRLSLAGALALSDELEGPAGRFQMGAPREQRVELAGDLRAAVKRAQARLSTKLSRELYP